MNIYYYIIIILIIYYFCKSKKENYSQIEANKIIYNLIKKNKNFSIARCGVGSEFVFAFDYMFNKNIIPPEILHSQAGIYFDESKTETNSDFNYEKELYSQLYLDAIRNCDYLGAWYDWPNNHQRELYFINKYKLKHFRAEVLDFQDVEIPWTYALKNKKVLVISPFADIMKHQYKKRKFLFKNKKILPKFKLHTITALSTSGFNKIGKSWYDNYKVMCDQIDKIDFDIALLSCGGYGHPLLNYIKMDKKKSAIYTGGSLQLLFGIKGKRWDDRPAYSSKYNKYWVRPTDKIKGIQKPSNIDGLKKTESGCYL